MGKRRMTHQSENYLNSTTHSNGLWGLLPEVDRTQWKWEAPKSRSDSEEPRSGLLPSWLIDLVYEKGEDTRKTSPSTEIEDPIWQKWKAEERVLMLQSSIKDAHGPGEIEVIFSRTLPRLKKDIILGLISPDILDSMLHEVSRDLREASKLWNLSLHDCLLSFYSAIWEGSKACVALQLIDVNGKVLNRFLSLLACLPITEPVQILATSIILSTSPDQQKDMQMGIRSVVLAWSQSWLAQEEGSVHQASLIRAETALLNIHHSLEALRTYLDTISLNAVQNSSSSALDMPRKYLSKAQSAASLAAEAIYEMEESLFPIKASTRRLSTALDGLSPGFSSAIILSCLDSILVTSNRRRKGKKEPLYCWLFTVARMSTVGNELFLQIWRKLDPYLCWNNHSCSEIVLDHWTSQGLLRKPVETGISLAVSDQQHLGALLLSLDKHRQSFMTRARELFIILMAIGRHDEIIPLLQDVRSLGLKLPITCLAFIIKSLSEHDNRLAMQAYSLHFRLRNTSNGCTKRLSDHFTHHFFTNLIQDPKIKPHTIWRLLGIPYDGHRLESRSPRISSGNNLGSLVAHIVMQFTQCQSRSSRVALRNAENGLRYLLDNELSIKPILSKALAHAGISREIEANQFIGQERLRYLLSMIEKIEGIRVANRVEDVVFKWRRYRDDLSTQRRRVSIVQHMQEKREDNVLRVGPID